MATATYTIVLLPIAAVAPASLGFGSQATGTTSAVQTVTLSYTGSGALAVAGIAISGDFSQTNNCGSSVTFTPTAVGTRTGTLAVTETATA